MSVDWGVALTDSHRPRASLSRCTHFRNNFTLWQTEKTMCGIIKVWFEKQEGLENPESLS